jgi:hypothetical protein
MGSGKAEIACKFSWIDEFQFLNKMLATAISCWGEDSNLMRLNVSANRFEAGPNPASRLSSQHIRQLGGEKLLRPDVRVSDGQGVVFKRVKLSPTVSHLLN